MFIEISLIVLALVLLISASKPNKKSVPPLGTVPEGDVLAPQPEHVKRNLRIEGTEAFTQDRSVLAGFGLSQLKVEDIKVFRCTTRPLSLNELPPSVVECAQSSYSGGNGRGLDLAYFMAGQRLLKLGEAVYFVLVTPVHSAAFIVSFLTKTR
jgi:hypothetical protein